MQKVFEKPDLILLDVNMPQMDGFAVCSQIRDYVNCPIIFSTARMEDADKIKGFSVGGDDYMLKPFSMDELGARIVTCQGEIIDFAKKEFDIIELLYFCDTLKE